MSESGILLVNLKIGLVYLIHLNLKRVLIDLAIIKVKIVALI